MDGELHVGRDGIDIRGRDSILIAAVIAMLIFIAWLFWDHLANDEQRVNAIQAKIEQMGQDHAKIVSSMENIDKQLELQNYLMVATPEQERAAQRLIHTPRLLQRQP